MSTTTLLTSLPVRWSALTTLTMRSAVPAVEGEPATAVVAAAEARIKQKHRKMFPLSIRQKGAFGKPLFQWYHFPVSGPEAPRVTRVTHLEPST